MTCKPTVLIITGHGLNCEAESKIAWERAGADASLVHLDDVLEEPGMLQRFRALMLIGGFSYGDHLGSGRVMAQRLRHAMWEDLSQFVNEGGLVLGVCNGFQVLIQLGMLPGLDGEFGIQRLALMQNDCATFQNRWITVAFEPSSPCVFTRGLDRMELPVRHGEGKIFTPDRSVLAAVDQAGGVACRYIDPHSGLPTQAFPHNPNGSLGAIAGLCDASGRIFGLMPHPEAFLYPENHPRWELERGRGRPLSEGLGLRLFQNAVSAMRE